MNALFISLNMKALLYYRVNFPLVAFLITRLPMHLLRYAVFYSLSYSIEYFLLCMFSTINYALVGTDNSDCDTTSSYWILSFYRVTSFTKLIYVIYMRLPIKLKCLNTSRAKFLGKKEIGYKQLLLTFTFLKLRLLALFFCIFLIGFLVL